MSRPHPSDRAFVMPDLLIPLEVVVALVGLLVLLPSAWSFAPLADPGRRGLRLLPASTLDRMGKGWRLGVARYEADRIDWYRVFSLSPRPGACGAADLDVAERRSRRPESFAVLSGSSSPDVATAAASSSWP